MTEAVRAQWWKDEGVFDITIVTTPEVTFFLGTASLVVRFTSADRPGYYTAVWRMREAEALSFDLPLPAKARMIVTAERPTDGRSTARLGYRFSPEGWPRPPEAPKPTCPCCGQKLPT